MLAEPLKIFKTLITIAVLLVVFGLYTFLQNPWAHGVPSTDRLLAWTLPSQTLSLFALYFAGVVICLRYRSYGFCFLVAAIIYSACQQALYSATFLRFEDISEALTDAAPWFLAAAILKVILGGIFYFLSFLELSSYPRLVSPEPPIIPERMSRSFRQTAGWLFTFVFGHLVLAVLAALLVELAR